MFIRQTETLVFKASRDFDVKKENMHGLTFEPKAPGIMGKNEWYATPSYVQYFCSERPQGSGVLPTKGQWRVHPQGKCEIWTVTRTIWSCWAFKAFIYILLNKNILYAVGRAYRLCCKLNTSRPPTLSSYDTVTAVTLLYTSLCFGLAWEHYVQKSGSTVVHKMWFTSATSPALDWGPNINIQHKLDLICTLSFILPEG